MVYYYLDKTKGTKVVADAPGWESPRPLKKKENKMSNYDTNNASGRKIGGSPFNVDPTVDPNADIKDHNDPLSPKSPIYNNASSGIAAPVTGTNIDPFLASGAAVLTALTSVVVAKGWLDASSWIAVCGALLSVVATVYVAFRSRTEGKISSLATTLDIPKAAFKRHIVAAQRNYKL